MGFTSPISSFPIDRGRSDDRIHQTLRGVLRHISPPVSARPGGGTEQSSATCSRGVLGTDARRYPGRTAHYDPSPDLYDYAQTKAATMNYVKSLAKQLGPMGIRVNGVAPGPIWTPLQISGGAPEQKYETFGKTTVLGRPGQPAELASIYVQLAADDASFATGNIYGSGGGQGQP